MMEVGEGQDSVVRGGGIDGEWGVPRERVGPRWGVGGRRLCDEGGLIGFWKGQRGKLGVGGRFRAGVRYLKMRAVAAWMSGEVGGGWMQGRGWMQKEEGEGERGVRLDRWSEAATVLALGRGGGSAAKRRFGGHGRSLIGFCLLRFG